MLYNEKDKELRTMLIKATFELRQALCIEPYVKSYNQKNIKHYYFASVLDEILNLVNTTIRWEEFFLEDLEKESFEHPIGISIIQGISNEIKMYRRKNIEILTKLILFQETNDDNYYMHFILIREYNAINRRIKDFKDFFSIVPNNEQYEKKQVEHSLLESFKNISENKCWFLNYKYSTNSTNINGYKINTNENSFKTILFKAIKKADKYERLLLGLSYRRYSKTSEDIHNSIKLNEIDEEDVKNACRIELLMVAFIVNRCQELLKLYPDISNTNLNEYVSNYSNIRLFFDPLFEDIFKKNDYVYTNDGALGRIENIIISNVNYRSFKVKYLVNQFEGYGDYGFYPAHYLKRIHSRKQLEDILMNNSSEIMKEFFKKYWTHQKLTSGLDSIMSIWWLNGYKEKIFNKDNSKFEETINKMNSIINKEEIESLINESYRG